MDLPPVCDLCGATVAGEGELLVHEERRICAGCKPDYFQRLREGLPGGFADDEPEPPPLQRRLLWITLHGAWCGLLLWAGIWLTVLALPRRDALIQVSFFAGSLIAGFLHLWAVKRTLRLTFAAAPAALFMPSLLVCGALPVIGVFGCAAGAVLRVAPVAVFFLTPFAICHAIAGSLLWQAGWWAVARLRAARS